MTVGTLIAKFKRYHPDMPVIVSASNISTKSSQSNGQT
jgi:hypothetical protein